MTENQGGQEDQAQKYQRLIEQYEEVIYYLKEQGALLNNIRPYFLLSYNDFLVFQKFDKLKDQISLNAQKVSEN